MGQSSPVIQTIHLSKVYRSGRTQTRALDDLSLEVRRGEIFGYLGPNGAGKTTTIRLLLDLIRPSAGSALLFGEDTRARGVALRRRVGFLPGELNLWRNQTGERILRYLGGLRGMTSLDYAYTLAERFKLDLTKRSRDYSSGNRRKLGLLTALMHRPELLILDEPTGGLDPLMQQEFNALMREVRDEGRTVFLSSHILGEVQAICDRAAILRDGQLKAVETVERLTHVDFRRVEMTFREPVRPAWADVLPRIPGVSEVSADGTHLRLRLAGPVDPVLRAVADGYMETLRVEEPSLEEVFLAYYGNGVAPAAAAAKEAVR